MSVVKKIQGQTHRLSTKINPYAGALWRDRLPRGHKFRKQIAKAAKKILGRK